MDPLVALVVTAVAASALVVGSGLLLARALRRRARSRRLAHEQQMAASAAQIARLGEQVEALSADVARAEATRRASARTARAEEYVITTLAGTLAGAESAAARAAVDVPGGADADLRPASRTSSRPRLDLEGQLVGALARQRGTTAVRERAVEIVVHGVALAHGVRRALRPDTLDRAAAEAHVARRRSRRLRRAEVREARRLVRVLRDVA
jgi:hypothetical protein